MAATNAYDDLSDFENMVEEETIDPDFFIAQPPVATFVPASPGPDKSTVVNDREDPALFDFDLEVEPILQVLVGKAIELSKIEVIEENEQTKFEAHILKYQMLRESQLLAVQRLEAHSRRRQIELECRKN